MLFFLCTTAAASFMGLIIPRLIHLGKGVKFEMATSDIQATKMDSILDTVKNLIPSNPVKAFAEGNMLQVLVFSLIVGFTLIAIGEKGEPLLKVIDSLNEVCLKIISTVMYPHRSILYDCAGSRSKWNKNNRIFSYTACHFIYCIFWICISCIWSGSKNNWKNKSTSFFPRNYACSIKCIWNLF